MHHELSCWLVCTLHKARMRNILCFARAAGSLRLGRTAPDALRMFSRGGLTAVGVLTSNTRGLLWAAAFDQLQTLQTTRGCTATILVGYLKTY